MTFLVLCAVVAKADPKVDVANVDKVPLCLWWWRTGYATDACAWKWQLVSDLMATLMKEGDKGMEKVLATSAPGNPFKDLGYEKVSLILWPCRVCTRTFVCAPLAIVQKEICSQNLTTVPGPSGVHLHAGIQARCALGAIQRIQDRQQQGHGHG